MLARGWLAYLVTPGCPICAIHHHRRKPPKSGCLRHRIAPTARRDTPPWAKTAEERFNMLARGWLAYPVTPIHSHLPPKSGCRNVIPRFANNLYNRSSAVDSSFHNQPQVGKPTWGYDYPTALRRLPPPIVRHHHRIAHPHRPPSSSDCANSAMRKTAEERFNMLARGWLAYPVTPTHHPSTAEERL